MRKFYLLKLIIVFAGVILISSCQTHQLTPRNEEIKTFATDFRKYTEKGFLFMPDEYYGEYEVKGMITAELHPEVVYREGRESSQMGFTVNYFYDGTIQYSQIIREPDIEKLIDYIYELALEWGGNAFSNFNLNISTSRTDNNPNTEYQYSSISGLVIKRL